MRLLLASLVAVAAFGTRAADAPGFAHRPLLAGKVSFAGPGFEITRTLGVAAFAPEFRLPVELETRDIGREQKTEDGRQLLLSSNVSRLRSFVGCALDVPSLMLQELIHV